MVDGFSQVPKGMKTLISDEQQAQLSAQGFKVGEEAKVDEVYDDAPTANPYEELEVPDSVKKDFVRALLARTPFTQNYTLFGDAITLTFQTRKASVDRWCGLQEFAQHARLMRSLVKVKYDKSETRDNRALDKEIDPSTWNLFDDDSDIVYLAVMAEFQKFEDLCDLLYRNAATPDFWKGTAGRT